MLLDNAVVLVRMPFSRPAGSGAVLRWEGPFEGGPTNVRVAFSTRHAPGTLPTGEPARFVTTGAGYNVSQTTNASPGIEEVPSLRADQAARYAPITFQAVVGSTLV